MPPLYATLRRSDMIAADVPLLTGDTTEDIRTIRLYLMDLQRRLETPLDTGWATNVAAATDKVLNTGDTLADVVNVLGSLIQVLLTKGVLNG